jgi:NitT/TauT family transport system permease protein
VIGTMNRLTDPESSTIPVDEMGVSPQEPVNSDGARRRVAGLGDGGLSRSWRGALSITVALMLLEAAGRTGLLDSSAFPLVSEVLARLGRDAMTARFWAAVAQTLSQALTGLVGGSILAIPIGLVLGRVRTLEKAIRPIIEFLRPIPSVAVLPLVILMLGVSFSGAALLAGISSFWLILVLTIRGARAVDPVAQQTLTLFGVPRLAQFWHLVLPSSTPFIVTGIRIAASVALIVAITAELLGGMPGLGKEVQSSLQNADATGMYSYTLAAGILGVLVNAAVLPIENRLLQWHPSRRSVSK